MDFYILILNVSFFNSCLIVENCIYLIVIFSFKKKVCACVYFLQKLKTVSFVKWCGWVVWAHGIRPQPNIAVVGSNTPSTADDNEDDIFGHI